MECQMSKAQSKIQVFCDHFFSCFPASSSVKSGTKQNMLRYKKAGLEKSGKKEEKGPILLISSHQPLAKN
jgi:hypothetical protein